jgi:hypothetical protein
MMSFRSTVCGCVKRVDVRFRRRIAVEITVAADSEHSRVQNVNWDAATLCGSAGVGMDDAAKFSGADDVAANPLQT